MTENEPQIPDAVVDTVADADDAMLREIISYVESELATRRQDLLDVEPKPGQEFVEVTEEDGHTRVALRRSCVEGCDDCPHGPYLYHIRPERGPDGEMSLHWSYVGTVADDGG